MFYAFNLEELAPANHLLRGINRFLDLSELHQHLAPHYSHTCRPSIDPAPMIRMLIIGIRSERQLCEEVHLNLAYRWFCRLGLEDAIPDHSTFSKNRRSERDLDDGRAGRRALRPQAQAPDGRYHHGTAEMLGWMVDEKSIEPHVPVWDKAGRKDGTLGRSDFQWNAEADEYRCPRGKPLRSTGKPPSNDTLIYRSSVYDCMGCELKSLCYPNTTHRKIARQANEAARDVARQVATTQRYQQSRKDRKKVEMLFAHLKRILRLDRDCGFVGCAVPRMNSSWRQQHKTYD